MAMHEWPWSHLLPSERETGSWKWAVLQLVYMTILAYVGALIVFQGCTAFGVG